MPHGVQNSFRPGWETEKAAVVTAVIGPSPP